MGVHTAVYHQHLAGHVRRGVAGQEQRRADHLVGFGGAFQQGLRAHGLRCARAEVADHVGVDSAPGPERSRGSHARLVPRHGRFEDYTATFADARQGPVTRHTPLTRTPPVDTCLCGTEVAAVYEGTSVETSEMAYCSQ